MPPVSDAVLTEMEHLLATGPLLIGETHDEGHARVAICKLIDRRAVKFLSIETPVGPEGMVLADGQIRKDKLSLYFGGVSTSDNVIMTTKALAEYTVGHGVALYCHDVPLHKSGLNFHSSVGGDMSVYPRFASQFLPASMPNLPTNNGKAADLFRERNEYSANYLRAQLGAGIKCLYKLVILGGSYHFRVDQCGAGRTLQAYLGVADTRVRYTDA